MRKDSPLGIIETIKTSVRPIVCYEFPCVQKGHSFSLQMMNCDLRLLILCTQDGTQCDEEYENASAPLAGNAIPHNCFLSWLAACTSVARVCVCVCLSSPAAREHLHKCAANPACGKGRPERHPERDVARHWEHWGGTK